MNPDIKEQWVAALRSGDYNQGKYKLRSNDNDKFCCLGVLCDLTPNDVFEWAVDLDLGGLPKIVQEWCGIEDRYGMLEDETDLAWLNDHGYTFEQIADVIEEQF